MFHFGTTEPAMRLVMEQIFNQHGKQGLIQALTALRSHIEHNELNYAKNMKKMRQVVDDFELLT
jgi:hypothetical protein